MPDVCTDSTEAPRCAEPVCCLFADRRCGVRQTELCLHLALIALLLLHIANHTSANTPQLMDPDK